MLIDKYYDRIDELFAKVKSTQRENAIKAGKICAEAVLNGGCLHVFDNGHIINSELINRGGGLFMLKQFKYEFKVENPVRKRNRDDIDKSIEGLAAYAIKASGARPGDVMFIGSVSGKTANVVDLAIEAKKFGMTVIAVTSLEYSSAVKSEHSSGKRLFECADLVLDNCAPKGEAMMDVEGLGTKFGAASGLAAAFIMWSVCSVIVEELIAHGEEPSVYRSYNFPGGWEWGDEKQKRYDETGF